MTFLENVMLKLNSSDIRIYVANMTTLEVPTSHPQPDP